MKNENFLVLLAVWVFFPEFLGSLRGDLCQNCAIYECPIQLRGQLFFILFYEQSWQGGVFKIKKNDHFFSVFSRLDPFSKVFGLVKDWPMLELHETISV